jgi:hypothetical protein
VLFQFVNLRALWICHCSCAFSLSLSVSPTRNRGGGDSYHKRLAAFAKTELLIVDEPLTQAERLDLLVELIDDRQGRRSTLVTSQLPIAQGPPTLLIAPTTRAKF